MDDRPRCAFAAIDPLYIAYHDDEWGVPEHHDRRLFEFLVLEGAQAGLSWLTVLRRRPAYRTHFDDFDPQRVAAYDADRVAGLLQEPALIKNRLKIASAVTNAQAFLSVQDHFGSFDAYLWQFVDGQPLVHHWTTAESVPSQTPLSETISRDLRSRGFRFVGPVIVYAYLQATGVVMDHLTACFRYAALSHPIADPADSDR